MTNRRPIDLSPTMHCETSALSWRMSSKRMSSKRLFASILLGTFYLLIAGGCTSVNYLNRNDVRRNRLAAALSPMKMEEPAVSERTLNVLTRYSLKERFDKDRSDCLNQLRNVIAEYPLSLIHI